MIGGKYKYLGSYDTAKQAAKVYDKEAIKVRRPFISLNYPKKAPVGYTPMQKVLASNNTVGYRGVSKNKKKFAARITIGGKKTHIGTYDTPKEAAIAYDRAVLKANKSTTLLNFPDMVHNLDVEPKPKKNKRSSSRVGIPIKEKKETTTGDGFLVFTIDGNTKHVGTYDKAIVEALAGYKIQMPTDWVPVYD